MQSGALQVPAEQAFGRTRMQSPFPPMKQTPLASRPPQGQPADTTPANAAAGAAVPYNGATPAQQKSPSGTAAAAAAAAEADQALNGGMFAFALPCTKTKQAFHLILAPTRRA